jgi:hypothetical protein
MILTDYLYINLDALIWSANHAIGSLYLESLGIGTMININSGWLNDAIDRYVEDITS